MQGSENHLQNRQAGWLVLYAKSPSIAPNELDLK